MSVLANFDNYCIRNVVSLSGCCFQRLIVISLMFFSTTKFLARK
uniref:Uncharacterized protein n=1 Tax=Rhizophora mucronata TaxID=61149 RepID=A0A2P2K498_RHIMU